MQPSPLLAAVNESSEQDVSKSQEGDMSYMPRLQENSVEDLMLLYPKVHSQAEWYHRTGEMLPTLHAVMGYEDTMPLPIETTKLDGLSASPHSYISDIYEDVSSFMGSAGHFVAPLIALYMMYITTLK